MPPSPTLTCKQCNYENEPERVYCHNCGAKLDRTILPKEPAKKGGKETPEKAARRVAKLVNPNRGFFTNWHKTLLNTLASAACIAAVIQMVRPPDGVPPVSTKDEMMTAPPLVEQIEEVQIVTTPQTRQIQENSINVYLASAIRTKGDTSDDYFKFDRAFVNLGKDVIHISTQLSAFGYPVYAGASYKLAIADNRLVSTNVGGNVGRLPVHPLIMEYSSSAFQQLWDALQRERSLMNKMQSVSIQPGVFEFTTKAHP
jgi:hypothetical protein